MPELFPGALAPTTADRPPGPPPRPKLRRSERIPDPRRWRDVVPPVLAEQVADSEQLAAHRKLVGRVEAAAAKLAELRAAHAQAVEADKRAEQAFATKGRKLSPPTAPAAIEVVEAAERELGLLTRQLPKSADRVWQQAYPFLEQAQERLERLLDDDDEAVEAAISEALRLLDQRAEVGREAAWVGAAMWETSLAPFNPDARRVANSRTAAELRARRVRHAQDAAVEPFGAARRPRRGRARTPLAALWLPGPRRSRVLPPRHRSTAEPAVARAPRLPVTRRRGPAGIAPHRP